MTNLYVATRVLTAMGTVLRAFWEQLVCRICGIPAEDVRAFKVSELCGYVEHELTENKKQTFLICFLPFTLNFILSICFLLGGAYKIVYVGDLKTLTGYLFFWLGISFAANCVPSFEDVLSFKDFFYSKDSNVVLKVILAPFFAVIYGFSILERYSLTFVAAIIFAIAFPYIFSYLFPVITTIVQMLS